MSDLLVSDFDFDLPEELIAQQPPAQRGAGSGSEVHEGGLGVLEWRFNAMESNLSAPKPRG